MWTRAKNWSEATGKEADLSVLGNTKVAQNNMLTQSMNGSVNGNIAVEVKNSSGNDVNVNDGRETTSIKPGVASTMKLKNLLSNVAANNGFAFQ